MRLQSRIVLGIVVIVGIVMIALHMGGKELHAIGLYSPLLGAFIGGLLTLIVVNIPLRSGKEAERWLTGERLAWIFIGCACIAWAIGECFWRHYLSIGQAPFPSLADLGYASFPPLIFLGLILLPSSRRDHRYTFFLLDSLISMGALLSIAWFLLLGSLVQAASETLFAKVLSMYYPIMDIALLSGTIFLLLREHGLIYQARARRISLLLVGLGLAVFATSDFVFNIQQSLGTYVDGTWIDLGWPLGMMTLGVAAYLRRFLPATPSEVLERRIQQKGGRSQFEPAQALPYLLLVVLFGVMVFNVLSVDHAQQSIRPVLVIATMIVVALVLARQILTMFDNARLLREREKTFQELENLNRSILERNTILEEGIAYLKEIQTRLANGEVRARATMTSGNLWPLAVGLNLMADRMMRTEHDHVYAQKLANALSDLSLAFVRMRSGGQFVLPVSCVDFPEVSRLLHSLGMESAVKGPQSQYSEYHRSGNNFSRQESSASFLPKQPSDRLKKGPDK